VVEPDADVLRLADLEPAEFPVSEEIKPHAIPSVTQNLDVKYIAVRTELLASPIPIEETSNEKAISRREAEGSER
jgi:hypothetical protein